MKDGHKSEKRNAPVSKVLFLGISLLLLALTLLGMSYYNASRCMHVKDPDETEKMIFDMRRRLRELESQNIYNAVVVKDLLKLFQVHLRDQERESVDKISALSEDKAVKLALLLAGSPDLHIERFDLDEKFASASALFDAVDQSLGKGEDSMSKVIVDSAVGSIDTSPIVELSDAEQTEKCKSWQQLYRVKVGQSWGDLPLTMQRAWVDYSCDGRVSDFLA